MAGARTIGNRIAPLRFLLFLLILGMAVGAGMTFLTRAQAVMAGFDIAATVFETHVGGNIYDRGVDGSQCRWARVLAYEPPDRVVFSWDISPHWQIETDLDKTSEVEVRFIAETPDRTRVELEHRNLDRHGDGWEAERDGVGGDQGWPLYLERFAEQVAS